MSTYGNYQNAYKKASVNTLDQNKLIIMLYDGAIKNARKKSISGTEAREMFKNNIRPPKWYMRNEIANMIMQLIKKKDIVFID